MSDIEISTPKRVSLTGFLIGLGMVLGGLIGGTATVLAQSRQAGADGAKVEIAQSKARVDDVEATAKRAERKADDARADVQAYAQDVRGMREDLRLYARGRPLPPLPPVDGGTP